MSKKIGILMDPIQDIKPKKDTTLAMMLEAQKRDYTLYYFGINDLYTRDGETWAHNHLIKVTDSLDNWYNLTASIPIPLNSLDIILIRKDPPFDRQYLYMTQLLEPLTQQGCLVVNDPQGLRDANEKLFINQFPKCIPPTLVTSKECELKNFIKEQQDVVLKPLHAMGGHGVFRVTRHDPNISAIIETITHHQQEFVMAQKFIQEVSTGDKRIILINGEAIPFGLLRTPPEGEIRANLARGGTGSVVPITEREQEICNQLKPILQQKKLSFVGIDVIGDYLTEINITSPTCLREISAASNINIAEKFFDHLTSLKP